MVHWLNGADTIMKAEERGKRIAQRLLLGGLKRGVEIKEFNTFIGKISYAFKELLDKGEADEKSHGGTDMSELKKDMAAKELDYHCNSLCFTLFVGVEQAIDEELKALALEAALDSLLEVCEGYLTKCGDGVVATNTPNLLGNIDDYGEKEQDAKQAGTGEYGGEEPQHLTFPDIPYTEGDADADGAVYIPPPKQRRNYEDLE
jgi:hypothetical protein